MKILKRIAAALAAAALVAALIAVSASASTVKIFDDGRCALACSGVARRDGGYPHDGIACSGKGGVGGTVCDAEH